MPFPTDNIVPRLSFLPNTGARGSDDMPPAPPPSSKSTSCRHDTVDPGDVTGDRIWLAG
jgi:hypothetical protein